MRIKIFHSKIHDKLGLIIDKDAYYYKVTDEISEVVKIDKTTIPYEDICTVVSGKFDGDDFKVQYARGIADTLTGKQYAYRNWYGKWVYLNRSNGCIHFINDFLNIFHKISISEHQNTEKAFLMLLDIYGL